MNNYGLTTDEQRTHLQKYNHALFQNSLAFMDIVWEINLLYGTVAVMYDKTEPELNNNEYAYDEFLAGRVLKRIPETERELFFSHMSADRLAELKEDIIFYTDYLAEDCLMRPYRVVLTPYLDKDGKTFCVYFGASNLQDTVHSKEAMKDDRFSAALISRSTVSHEDQFRRAVLSGSLMVYNINLTKNLIEDEFYEIVDNVEYPMLELVGLKAPCSLDEFRARWCEAKIPEESKETFLKLYNREYLLDAYARGEYQLEIEFDTSIGRGIPITLRSTILLIKDNKDDVIAMINGKDVTAQRREEHERRMSLKAAFDAANRANSAKSDFLARMSHDIRTPLNAILGMTAIATASIDDRERVQDCLNKINVSGKRLLALINDVLDVSNTESGRIEIHEESFVLPELVDELVASCVPDIKAKAHELDVAYHEIVNNKVIGDSQHIRQAFMNIMSNAVKYTPDGGKISLQICEKPTNKPNLACFEFVFEDNGIGMSEDFTERAFEPFERADDERARNEQGTGLGLTIAKNIVQMMNGKIDIQSELDMGTRVTVSIYLKLDNEKTVPAAESRAFEAEAEPSSLAVLDDIDFSGKRALLVEDNELNAEIAAEILGMIGLEVERVENGKMAVEAMQNSEDGYYDIVFMDIQMPVMNGYDAVRNIRAIDREYTRLVPILAMSANSFAEDVYEAKAAGMNDHMAKPLDFELLRHSLIKWLK